VLKIIHSARYQLVLEGRSLYIEKTKCEICFLICWHLKPFLVHKISIGLNVEEEYLLLHLTALTILSLSSFEITTCLTIIKN